MKVVVVSVACVLSLVLLVCGVEAREDVKLQGVWRVASIVTADGANQAPQPAIYIFTHGYYSLTEVSSNTPRPSVPARLADATATQLIAAFGPSFNAQSGRYKVSAGSLELVPLVAKNPMVMAAQTASAYKWDVVENVLTLTSVGAAPGTRRLTKLE